MDQKKGENMIGVEQVMFACGASLGAVFAATCITAERLWGEYVDKKRREQTVREYDELEIVIDLRGIQEEINGGEQR